MKLQAEFWMMNKIIKTDNAGLDKLDDKRHIIKAVLSLKRFGPPETVYRSLDLVKSIQKNLRGSDYSRNLIKQILFTNFMSKGEVFLD